MAYRLASVALIFVAFCSAAHAAEDIEDDANRVEAGAKNARACPAGTALRGVDVAQDRVLCGTLHIEAVWNDPGVRAEITYGGATHTARICSSGGVLVGWQSQALAEFICARPELKLNGPLLHPKDGIHLCDAGTFAVGIQRDGTLVCQGRVDTAIDLYVRTIVGTTQLCMPLAPQEASDVRRTLSALAHQKLATGINERRDNGRSDILAHVTQDHRLLLVTICKTGDVYTFTVTGYATAAGKIASGSQSGTLEALEIATPESWENVFGERQAPLIPNVAFLPVANDTNNINERLLHNVPMTWIATPAPAAPLAPGASVAPTPPPTRLDECLASADKMLVAGRTNAVVQGNDLTRAILAGGSLKWDQPGNISAYYISGGVLSGLLYNPANAEIGADVFYCGTGDGKVYEVGGRNHHIVGHKTTPAIGTDSFAQTRALDLATVDLEDQLFCIIHDRVRVMGISDASLNLLYDNAPFPFRQWCDRYIAALPSAKDAPVDVPLNSAK